MGEYLVIISRDVSQKVAKRSVLYLEQKMREVRFCTDKGEVYVKGKVRDMVLAMADGMYLCHQYLAINLDRVEKMTEESVFFDSGDSLKMGRNKYIETRKAFNDYLKSLL